MADKTAFEIPEPMRAFADKSVDQAKKAFDDFMAATAKAVEKAEASAKSLHSGTQDVGRQAVGYMEENVAASFEFAQRMVRATTIEEIGELHKEFLKRQLEAAQSQTRDLSDMIGRVASQTADKAKG